MLRKIDPERVARRIVVRGVVQGVGFRPFVFRIARRHGLDGWVRNDGTGVEIRVQGAAVRVERFIHALAEQAPPTARVSLIEPEVIAPDPHRSGFSILPSAGGQIATTIGPDLAVCGDCLEELFDPQNRRYRYPFINCTHCGPRYTLTRRLPYDRATTSMAGFALCPECGSEYADPANRRFHAEPNACPACGPRLSLREVHDVPALVRDPISATGQRLRLGEIVAVKGLGGFHLACDAANPFAVATLRDRKRRPAQPFALMVANVASARRLARVSDEEARLLESPERPVVLLAKAADFDRQFTGIAPGLDEVGLMLPATPIQFLLFHEAAGRPDGTAWLQAAQDLTLVMTSANPHGEPLVRENEEAFERLEPVADEVLFHDREIVARCDDSVLRVRADLPGHVQFLRRARGYTPLAWPLGRSGPAVLAFGAHLKATVCLTRGAEAFLSPHVGGLENPAACAVLDETAERLQALLATVPDVVAHDLHPDYHSTRAALVLAERLGVPAVAVQHHHAHIAAVCAEHGIDGPVLGFAADGSGLGSDGLPWGGELLRVDGADFTRLGHLAPLALPGGDKAAREPWRVACGVLHALGLDELAARRFADQDVTRLLDLLARGLRCPPTTSLGRWFDAAAGLLGVRSLSLYEGHAAMALETQARRYGAALPHPGGWHMEERPGDGSVLSLYPLFPQLADETAPARRAAVFHATLVDGLVRWIGDAARAQGLRRVALGGGCLLNRLLAEGLRKGLLARGLEVFEAGEFPTGDGGIALGQAWVARLAVRDGRIG